jgi:hypothetical protein
VKFESETPRTLLHAGILALSCLVLLSCGQRSIIGLYHGTRTNQALNFVSHDQVIWTTLAVNNGFPSREGGLVDFHTEYKMSGKQVLIYQFNWIAFDIDSSGCLTSPALDRFCKN